MGPAGRFLRKELNKAGLNPTSAYYLNVVSCFPNRTPTTDEVLACKDNLVAQWELMTDVEYVLVCGKVALEAILPHATAHTRNKAIKIHGKIIFPVYHPSYVLFHDPTALPAWRRSLIDFYMMWSGWAAVEDYQHVCVYCRKKVDSRPACLDHMGKWRKDQSWKRPKPEQLGMNLD